MPRPRLVRRCLATIALLLLLFARGELQGQSPGQEELTSGIDTTHFDRSTRPQDNFFRHVSGGWLQ